MNSDYFKKTAWIFLLLLALTGCVQGVPTGKKTGPTVPACPNEQLLAAGVRSFKIGDYAPAMRFFKEALVVSRGVDDGGGMARAEVNMAETALAMGEVAEARGHLSSAQRLVEREGLATLAPHLRMIAASLAIREGRRDAAIAILTPYLAKPGPASATNGPAEFRLAALINRIELALAGDRHQFRQWLSRYRQALAGMQSGKTHYRARLLRFEAQQSQWDGNRRERDRLLEQALAIYRRSKARPGIAAVLAEWGRYLMEDQEWTAARDRFDRAFFVRVDMQDSYGCDQVLTLLESLDHAVGDPQQGEETQHWRAVIRENQPRLWSSLLQMRNPAR